MSTPEAIVSVKNLWKVFGEKPKNLSWEEIKTTRNDETLKQNRCVAAMRDVTFDIKKGEFFVIMGLSGSGKSTLIRTLIRLIEPTRGEIVVSGKNIMDFDTKKLLGFRRNKISMVFQNYGLLPHKTVLENAAYGLKIRGMGKAERLEKARSAIVTVGLEGWENYYPDNLSGGMQQRAHARSGN